MKTIVLLIVLAFSNGTETAFKIPMESLAACHEAANPTLDKLVALAKDGKTPELEGAAQATAYCTPEEQLSPTATIGDKPAYLN